MSPELLGIIVLGVFLVLILPGLWVMIRSETGVIRTEFTQLNDRLSNLEERMARIEGALFYGPAAVQVEAQAPPSSNPLVRKRL